jgi:hypothetical protein
VVVASGWAALRVVARPAAAMASASAPWLRPPISCGHLGDFVAIYTYGLIGIIMSQIINMTTNSRMIMHNWDLKSIITRIEWVYQWGYPLVNKQLLWKISGFHRYINQL